MINGIPESGISEHIWKEIRTSAVIFACQSATLNYLTSLTVHLAPLMPVLPIHRRIPCKCLLSNVLLTTGVSSKYTPSFWKALLHPLDRFPH